MVQYRRARVAGATYFFTVALEDRRASLLTEHVELLRAAFRSVHAARPFDLDAIAVMPEHLHAIWVLPEGDADYATRWQLIKTGFTRALRETGVPLPSRSNGTPAVWQRRYWEHLIRDEDDWQRHRDYIFYNPVKHGQVSRVADWPHSSFHRMVRRGELPSDWGGDAAASASGHFGEP
ncbi:transposase [Solimonas sp. K1W22B-7]|uniref:REP-associated tyrosine transposase n=1 Tax=Solimonas sp. K1W22B-7 TaxID=2303331 RepID=UPI000E330975|nr:transposase [Solimonas sp. K1W22B-7]AXQ30879.1 transposase [Solimonas sp. K1W22B-7]